MQPITNLLISATRKAVKFLQRDFLELEMLQRTSSGNKGFCEKSYLKLKTLLQNELQRHLESLFFPEDIFEIDNNNREVAFLVHPIDSTNNLARSIPFFALSITYLKKIQETLTAVSTVIHFPALNEIYYAEKGKGAWVERDSFNSINNKSARLRVSGIADLKNSLTVSDNLTDTPFPVTDVRAFGSPCYSAILLAAGKIDIIYLSSLNYTLYHAFELIIKEAGGVVVNNNNKFIASNDHLKQALLRGYSKHHCEEAHRTDAAI
ncbi:inositol monophosphatase family protein [Rickettsia endosymbiont of Orchestes rusci]|uniref:inositol monophosphatase family protein n=1 Tax=Rickettsia endosymbiont of Orchestes rusci TaxID=3066250 RepID=UPI00313A8E56